MRSTKTLYTFLSRCTALVGAVSITIAPMTPAYADVVLTSSAATDETVGAARTILTNQMSGSVGVNTFSEFNIDAGQTLNLVQPSAATALVNIVTGSTSASSIYGTLNFEREGGGVTNAYLADPNGFVVGSTGVINAHRLTMSTAVSGSSVEDIVNSTAALSDADITIESGARINTHALSMWTAGNLVAAGTITATLPHATSGFEGGSVNTSGTTSATHALVENGVIRFGAGTATISGSMTANADDEGGQVIGAAQTIAVDGADIDTTAADSDGRVALIANHETEVTGAPVFGEDEAEASITLTNASITAGAIVISATAFSTNVINTEAETQSAQDAFSGVTDLDGFIDTAKDLAIARATEAARDRLTASPLALEEITANSRVNITGSTLVASNLWSGAVAPTGTAPVAANGFLGNAGLVQTSITDANWLGNTAGAQIAQAYDATTDAVFIHSHGQTTVDISPDSGSMSLALAQTSTNSALVIDNSTISTIAGDVVLASTAAENLNIEISVLGPTKAVTLAVTQQALNNQLRVSGGFIGSAGAVQAGAFTGVSHALSNLASGSNAGSAAKNTVAFSYSTANRLTQAALGGVFGGTRNGALETVNGLDLDAETLYFDNTRNTIAAAAGNEEDNTQGSNSESRNTSISNGASSVAGSLTGGRTPAGSSTSSRGLSIDVQLFDDETIATLGGSYRDTPTTTGSIGSTSVNSVGNVSIDAAQRYASAVEAGQSAAPSLTRRVKSEVGTNTGGSGTNIFLTGAISELRGQVTAEIGAAATVTTTANVSVNALTQYQTLDQMLDFRGRFWRALDVDNFDAIGPDNIPDFSQLDQIVNADIFLSSQIGVQTLPGLSGGANGYGASVNLFETDNDTRAIIATGATIINAAQVDVNARQQAVFTHFAANGGGGSGASKTIGANVSVPRMYSDVRAVIGDAILTNIGDLNVAAHNDVMQMTLAKAGGFSASTGTALNAAVATAVFETVTFAGVGAGAAITARDVSISAVDDSVVFTSAGTFGRSSGSTTGSASGTINIISRDTRAWFGDNTGSGASLTAASLGLTAENTGNVIALGIAGGVTTGSPMDTAVAMTVPQDSLVGAAAHSVITGGSRTATGSLALNLMQKNDSRAFIQTQATVNLAGDLTMLSVNRTADTGVAGAISAALGATGRGQSLAGGVAYKTDNRSVISEISAATIVAENINLQSVDSTRAVYVAMGGSGATGAALSAALAGSLVRMEETGATRIDLRNANLTTRGTQSYSARNSNAVIGVAGAAAASNGGSIGVSSSQIDSSRTAQIIFDTAVITGLNAASTIDATVRQNTEANTSSYSAAVGKFGGGATVALSNLTGSATLTADDTQINSSGSVTLQALQATDQDAIAGGLGAATTGAFGAANATGINKGGAQVLVTESTIAASSVVLNADGHAALQTRGYGFSFGTGVVVVGLGTAVNTTQMVVTTSLSDSTILASGNVKVNANATTNVDSIAMSLAASTSSAVTGSAVYNDVRNAVTTSLSGSGNGSRIWAGGSLAILSSAANVLDLRGHDTPITDLGGTGNLTIGGVAGIGLSLIVNRTNNQVRTEVLDGSDLVAFGHETMDLGARLGTAQRGVTIDAFGQTTVTTLAAAITAAGKAAVAASFSYNTLADNVVTRIGNGADITVNTTSRVERSSSDATDMAFMALFEPSVTDEVATHSNQNLVVTSNVANTVDDYSVLVQASGGGAAGGAGNGNLILSQARTEVNPSLLMAQDSVTLASNINSSIDTVSFGFTVSSAALAGSVTYNSIKSSSDLVLSGARVSTRETTSSSVNGETVYSGGDITLTASNNNTMTSRSGNVALGKAAGAGSAVANVIQGNATIRIGGTTEDRLALSGTGFFLTPTLINSSLSAANTLRVEALSTTDVSTSAISGSIGGAAGAFSVGVSLVGTQTTVLIDHAQALSGRDIEVEAIETSTLTDKIGGVAAGALGVGGAVNVVNFTGGAKVFIGSDATLVASNDVTLSAIANRNVDATLGVATIAGAALNAVVSVITLDGAAGGASDQANTTLARADNALDQNNATAGGSVGETLASETGSSDVVAATQTDQQGAIAVTQDSGGNPTSVGYSAAAPLSGTAGRGLRDVGVQIGAGAQIRAGNDILVDASVNADVDQTIGIASLSGVSVSVSVAVLNLDSEVDVIVGQNAALRASNSITLSARTTTPGEVDSDVYAIAASTGASIGAGVSFVDLNSSANVDVLDGAVIEGLADQTSVGSITIIAQREDVASAEILSAAGSLGIAVSGTYTKVENRGSANVNLGRVDGAASTLRGGVVSVNVGDRTSASAQSITAQGAGFAAGAGAFAIANNASNSTLNLDRVRIYGDSLIQLNNINSGTASSTALGEALAGGGAIVVSRATSDLSATLVTDLNASAITAARVEILTQITSERGDNVRSDAQTLTLAGALAGSGAESEAYTAYSVTTNVGGGADNVVATSINATAGALVLRTGTGGIDGVVSRAIASGKVGGALAVGVVLADVGQIGGNRHAVVTNNIISGSLTAYDTLLISADNTQNLHVDVTAGAGGIAAGSGGEANAYSSAVTTSNIGMVAGETLYLRAGDIQNPDDTRLNGELALRSSQLSRITSRFDNRTAALLGASGAVANSDFNGDVDLNLGAGVTAYSNFADISARNSAWRGNDAPNMIGRAAGVASGAALYSRVTGDFNVDTTINDGASLYQMGDPDLAKRYLINTRSEYGIGDYVVIDAAGAVALPFGDTNVTVTHTDAVTIGAANIFARGVLDISSGASGAIRSEQTSTASGIAGVPTADATTNYTGNSAITIGTGAYLESYRDIELNAGYVGGSPQTLIIHAEARVFNRTAVPVVPGLHPEGIARSQINTRVTIGGANDTSGNRARVIAYENIFVNASGGVRDVRGFAVAKDFYKQILGAVGGGSVVDIEEEATTDNDNSEVVINGELRSGAFNRRILNFNTQNVLDNGSLALEGGAGFESNIHAPSSDFYTVIENSDEVGELQAQRAALQARLDAGGLSAATIELTNNAIDSIDRRILSLSGVTNITRINVEYLRASEGSILISADRLTGSATGSLFAADEADIRVRASSGAILSLRGLEITNVEGGEISFNEVLLSANDPAYAFSISFAQNFAEAPGSTDGDNTIDISTSSGDNGFGDIEIVDRIVNRQGGILATSAFGSLYASGSIEGESVTLEAPNGNIEIVTPDPGVRYIGDAPYITWQGIIAGSREYVGRFGGRDYFSGKPGQEQQSVDQYNAEVRARNGANISSYTRTFIQANLPAAPVNPSAGITAGGNVVLSAEYLNINSPVVAGRGQFIIGFTDALQQQLNTFAGFNRQDRVELRADPTATTYRFADDAFYVPGISNETNATVYYNFATDQVEIDRIRANGGAIYITGSILSTGGGSLEAIDGVGAIDMNSTLTTDVVFNTLDMGNGQQGAGVIRIRDLARPFSYQSTNNSGAITVQDFVTTEYRYLNGQVEVYQNINPDGTPNYVNDPNIRGSERTPGLLTSLSRTQYSPVQGRDLVYVTENIDFYRMARYYVDIVAGNFDRVETPGASVLFRETKIPLGVGSRSYELGRIGQTNVIRNFAETADGYSPVQASLGDYDYRYDFSLSNWQVRGAGRTEINIPIYGGGTKRLTPFTSMTESDRALLEQEAVSYFDRPSRDAGFWRGRERDGTGVHQVRYRIVNEGYAPDLNLWPGDQRLISSLDGMSGLVYSIEPGQASREGSNNRLHTLVWAEEFLMAERTQHVHRFRADTPIDIRFSQSGSGTRESSLTSAGNIFFTRDVNVPVGNLTVTSTNGSIQSTNTSVSLNTRNLTLAANNGLIGGLGDAEMRINLAQGATLNASAGNSIALRQIASDNNLNIGRIETLNRNNSAGSRRVGGITLVSSNSIVGASGTSLVNGSDVTLDASAGSIGDGEALPLRVITNGGALEASAQTDIDVLTPSGDLGLRRVTTPGGSIRITAQAGAVVDRNSEEVQDLRTIDQLKKLWGSGLGLTDPDGVALRQAEAIEAFEAGIEVRYMQYWQQRGTGGPISFVLDTVTENALRGVTNGVANTTDIANQRVADYVAEMDGLYDIWNAPLSVFESDYEYVATDLQRERIAADMAWTEEELEFSVSSGVVFPTSDTNIRNESANIEASGDIRITALNGVGELSDGYVYDPNQPLTPLTRALLAAALPGDLTTRSDGLSVLRQEDDLNIEFSNIVDDEAVGRFSVENTNSDVYLASEEAVQVAQINTNARLELRIDGNLTNAGTAASAINAHSIQLESGIGGIGTNAMPLTLTTQAGGSLQFAAGTSAYVTSPTAAVSLVAASAGETLNLNAAGAITDFIGGTADRVFGDRIILSGASIGTDAQTLGLRQNDTSGSVNLTSTAGDIQVAVNHVGLNLNGFQSAAGGRILTSANAPVVFTAADSVRFANDATLRFVSGASVTTNATSGTDIGGGTLTIDAAATWGTATTPITTSVNVLSFTSSLPANTGDNSHLYLSEETDLLVTGLTQSDNATSQTEITTGGNLDVRNAVSAGRLDLVSGGTLDIGTAQAERAELFAQGNIGPAASARLRVGELDAVSQIGFADITLFGRDSDIQRLHLLGDQAATLRLVVESGNTVVSDAGIRTNGGAQTLSFAENLTMEAATSIQSAMGAIEADVDGDVTISRIETGNAGATALDLTFDGRVSVADPNGLHLVADAAGAVTTLRATDPRAPIAPIRLRTQVAALDATIARPDLHIDEQTAITLNNVVTGGRVLDVYATGDVTAHHLAANSNIVISSEQSIQTPSSTALASSVHLFAFGGSINAPANTNQRLRMSAGSVLNQYARDDINMAFADDGGQIGYGIAQTGDFSARRIDSAGGLTADVLSARGTVAAQANGDVFVNFVGRGALDLVDEVDLELVQRSPNRFGTVTFGGPDNITLEALTPSSEITLGLAELRQVADLNANRVEANLYDISPQDSLTLRVSGANNGFANQVAVNVLADDPAFAGFSGNSRPAIGRRQISGSLPQTGVSPRASGGVVMDFGRFARGEITLANENLSVRNVIASDAATFRQRFFDVYAETRFSSRRTDMDVQILSVEANGLARGELNFLLSDFRQITSRNIITARLDQTGAILRGAGTREEALEELASYISLNRMGFADSDALALIERLNLTRFIGSVDTVSADDAERLLDVIRFALEMSR